MDALPIDDQRPGWIQRLPELPLWTAVRPAGPWNLCGMLRGWAEWPQTMDFLAPDSPLHAWKALEDRLYDAPLESDLLGLGDAAGGLRILDAGCGIGRFAVRLARAGNDVLGVDSCLPSLEAAARHGAGLPLRLLAADLEALPDSVPSHGFDRVLAMEVLCYAQEPEALAARLVACLKPGGEFVASVEGWPGGLLADPSGATVEALGRRILAIPGERRVRLYTGPELRELLEAAGLEVQGVSGTHYVTDGPLEAVLDVDRVADPAYADSVVAAEARLRLDPATAPLARSFVAWGRRPA